MVSISRVKRHAKRAGKIASSPMMKEISSHAMARLRKKRHRKGTLGKIMRTGAKAATAAKVAGALINTVGSAAK